MMRTPKRRYACASGLFAALLTAFLSGTACRSAKGKADAGLIRVIDRISESDIVKTPLRNPDPENPSLAECAGLAPTHDLGTGKNPYSIKKKIHVGLHDFNALAAVPSTEIRFRLKIPPNARFEFNPAIRFDDGIFRASAGERKVTFAVSLIASGREISLLRKTMRLGPGKAIVQGREAVDLGAFAGEDAAISLVTEGDERALAFWINPVVYRARKDARFIILISLDTLRADHLACYGYGRDTSPNIDGLAGDGVRFARVISSSPWTLPSHMSLMTALNADDHGVTRRENRLDPTMATLAEVLKTDGFFNAALTGGGFVSGFFGFNKGFDIYRVLGRLTDSDAARRLCQSACRTIETNRDRNLFLFLHTYQIHAPFHPEEPFNLRYQGEGASLKRIDPGPLKINFERRYRPLPEETRRSLVDLYDAEIRYTDAVLIGPLVARLKTLGIYDRTMIILTSDHGEAFYEHGSWLHSHSVHDEVVHVPLIIKFFGSRWAGSTVEEFTRAVDVMPTICRELGIRTLPNPVDGKSLLDIIGNPGRRKKAQRTGVSALAAHAMLEHIPARMAVVSFPYKFIWNAPFSSDDLAYYAENPPPQREMEIYDLLEDPGETRDLSASRPDLGRMSRELMKSLRRSARKTGVRTPGAEDDIEKQLKTLGYL